MKSEKRGIARKRIGDPVNEPARGHWRTLHYHRLFIEQTIRLI